MTKNEKELLYVCPSCRQGGFLRGFGGTLTLGSSQHVMPSFIYHGRDIANMTPSDALSQDWDLVAAYISAAVQGEPSRDESERE